MEWQWVWLLIAMLCPPDNRPSFARYCRNGIARIMQSKMNLYTIEDKSSHNKIIKTNK